MPSVSWSIRTPGGTNRLSKIGPTNFTKASFATTMPLDPARRPLSPSEETAYVRAVLLDEVAARATIFVPPYHLGAGPDCPVRALDLRLARKAINRFRSLRLDEPRPKDPFPRAGQIFVCVCIRGGDLLDPPGRHMLAHLYSQLDADGFLVKVAESSERSCARRLCARLPISPSR